MRKRAMRKSCGLPALAPALFLLLSGCFYHVNLQSPFPLKIDPRQHQPMALLPVPSPPDAPQYGAKLTAHIRESLEEKGYILVSGEEVADALEEMKLTPLLLLSTPEPRPQVAERLKAGLLIIGTIPEYIVKKPYWGAQTFSVWNREEADSMSLPTYFQGSSQIRLILRMFESKDGSLVWMAEGTIRGSGGSAGSYGSKLAERLLEDLPPVSPPMGK